MKYIITTALLALISGCAGMPGAFQPLQNSLNSIATQPSYASRTVRTSCRRVGYGQVNCVSQ